MCNKQVPTAGTITWTLQSRVLKSVSKSKREICDVSWNWKCRSLQWQRHNKGTGFQTFFNCISIMLKFCTLLCKQDIESVLVMQKHWRTATIKNICGYTGRHLIATIYPSACIYYPQTIIRFQASSSPKETLHLQARWGGV